MLLKILTLLGALALFLYGMSLMTNGLKKLVGNKVRNFIPLMTGGRLSQIFGGFSLTTTMQSSKTTTMMVVSSVNAGLMTLSQAVGAILGANIGTTVTVWIVALLGFTVGAAYVGFPLLALGFVFMVSKNTIRKNLSEVVLGVGFVLIGVMYMSSSIADIDSASSFGTSLSTLSSHGFGSIVIYCIIGLAAAAILQSSSATITLSLIFAAACGLPLSSCIAVVVGANVGTAIDTVFFAREGNAQARRAALIHLLFNAIGAVLALLFFKPFSSLASWMSPLFAVCGAHSLFNIIAVILLVWFTSPIVRLVTRLVSDDSASGSRLRFISHSPLGTPAIAITEAMKEVQNFASISHEGYSYVRKAVNEKDADCFAEYKDKLVEYEEISDRMELAIANFLGKITTSEISAEEAEEIKVIYRIIGELESLGDSAENVGRILEREHLHGHEFNENEMRGLNIMMDKVEAAYKILDENVALAVSSKLRDIHNAYKAENEINETRDTLRSASLDAIGSQSDKYQSFNYFLDLLAQLEAMGDFMINISQALVRDED